MFLAQRCSKTRTILNLLRQRQHPEKRAEMLTVWGTEGVRCPSQREMPGSLANRQCPRHPTSTQDNTSVSGSNGKRSGKGNKLWGWGQRWAAWVTLKEHSAQVQAWEQHRTIMYYLPTPTPIKWTISCQIHPNPSSPPSYLQMPLDISMLSNLKVPTKDDQILYLNFTSAIIYAASSGCEITWALFILVKLPCRRCYVYIYTLHICDRWVGRVWWHSYSKRLARYDAPKDPWIRLTKKNY